MIASKYCVQRCCFIPPPLWHGMGHAVVSIEYPVAPAIQSNPLFMQAFHTTQVLAFCGCFAERGVLQGPLFMAWRELVSASGWNSRGI